MSYKALFHVQKLAGILLISVLCLNYSVQSTSAQGAQPLPVLPDKAILDKIIQETGGAHQTLLGVPAAISNQILSMAITLNPAMIQGGNNLTADKFFDVDHAVYYFSFDKGLKQILIPVAKAETTDLAPTMTASDSAPAQMIGAGYDFASGPFILVVTWKDAKATKPSELRAYTFTNGQLAFTSPYKLINRKLKGNKAGKVAPWDKGVIIAARETCFSLNLDQVCYSPTKQDKQPDAKAASQVDDALKALAKTYDIKAKIDVDGALPEIAGVALRKACAAMLGKAMGAAAMVSIPECAANMAFTGVNDIQPGQPIGAMVLSKDIDQPAYDLAGTSTGKVLAGSYLILDATPDITDPGAPGVLMLVNADGKTHYLIPSQVIEGFGDSDDKDSNLHKGQAGIKDATVGAHGY